jgi:hypothetical protein
MVSYSPKTLIVALIYSRQKDRVMISKNGKLTYKLCLKLNDYFEFCCIQLQELLGVKARKRVKFCAYKPWNAVVKTIIKLDEGKILINRKGN